MKESVAEMECCVVCDVVTPVSGELSDTVALFKALADATRFEILRLIADQPEQICVCDITGQFDVSQPTISHHLKVLREAGLITVSRRGVWAYYEVDRNGLERLQSLVSGLTAPVLIASG